MDNLFSPDVLAAFAQVILIDLVLAGDNAIVIGLAAAGLPPEQRNRAILVGVVAATVLRIAFAGVTTQLLKIVGLLFAGGILLLWVCWKMWRELRTSHGAENDGVEAFAGFDINADGTIAGRLPRKTFAAAAWQIVVADVTMSLDNVLAVAGAAREVEHRVPRFEARPERANQHRELLRRALHALVQPWCAEVRGSRVDSRRHDECPRRGPQGPAVHGPAGAQHRLPCAGDRSVDDLPQRRRPADVHPRRPRAGRRAGLTSC